MTHNRHERRPGWGTAALLLISAVMVVTFVLLGNWQMRRLFWKLDLIETVEARAFGDEQPLPARFDADDHVYLRVSFDGTPLPQHILVKAVTELGPGYWVMQPYATDPGLLWVNRGFVPSAKKTSEQWATAPQHITGLIRPSAHQGTLLERNDPAANRWVARDTSQMSQALGLDASLPYFVDADHLAPLGASPRGGLTIVQFRNSHLSYALTWYAMAVLFLGALIWIALRYRKLLDS
ncbi:SURF1 family protein [Epibacterium ulvae]|uniref:SURF1 family protein n=1 Tax=Epibacterium ulvae TaxID=1156985 RepID=UPI001BFCB45F|nr:SURF1 family protein [Epibacterium ulvae]MBT8153870.1 SURF1 family protein [Epibacterium ulvae]